MICTGSRRMSGTREMVEGDRGRGYQEKAL